MGSVLICLLLGVLVVSLLAEKPEFIALVEVAKVRFVGIFESEDIPVPNLPVEEQSALPHRDVIKFVPAELASLPVGYKVYGFEVPSIVRGQEVHIARLIQQACCVIHFRHVFWDFREIVGNHSHRAYANDEGRSSPKICKAKFLLNIRAFLYPRAEPWALSANEGIRTFLGCIYRSANFNSLPNNCPECGDQRPCSNTFRPCYEILPPLRLILAFLCLCTAVAINAYGRGWIRLLFILPFLATGWLILGGHKWYCQDDNRKYETDPNAHSGAIVLQKYLTHCDYCSTAIDMANVLGKDKQITVVSALAEGSSIRSIERMTGVNRNTIMNLGVRVGKGCTALLDAKMHDLPCRLLQFDEVWGFIGKKERHCRPDDDPTYGDVWTFCAIDADTKLVPSFKCGKRDLTTAKVFVEDVASRMRTRVQISSDALRAYVDAIEQTYGADVDYGQIVKTYEHDDAQNAERKYSAARFVSVDKRAVTGNPDMDEVSTSYIERLNATTRLHMRRLTRLTHAFSKKFENFEAAVGLHFAYYNLVRRHSSLRMTPAMAAGIERDFWSVGDLIEAVA